MTINEIKTAYITAQVIAQEYRDQVDAKCKAEGRMTDSYDPWSGRTVSVPAYSAEENVQNAVNNRRASELFNQLEAAKKAERKAKRAAKNAAQGITEEQRKAAVNAKRKATEIRKAQAEIERLQSLVAKLTADQKRYEEIARGL